MTLRELLKSYGLDSEQVENVMSQHGQAVQNEQQRTAKEHEARTKIEEELESLKEKNTELEKLAGETSKMRTELEQKSAKITDLEASLKKSSITLEINKQLTEAGALDYDAIGKLINMDAISTAEDGSITGVDKEIKRLKSGEYTGLLFKNDKPAHKDTYPVQTNHGEAKVNTESIGKKAAREANERKTEDNGRSQFYKF